MLLTMFVNRPLNSEIATACRQTSLAGASTDNHVAEIKSQLRTLKNASDYDADEEDQGCAPPPLPERVYEQNNDDSVLDDLDVDLFAQ